ncbi:MAG: hypothetical protein U0637_02390 [Phycisphaerales bacterium]
MAGKNTGFGGTGITIVLLAVGALGLFVAFAVFYGKYSDARQQLEQYKKDNEAIVKQGEANQDDIRGLMADARTQAGGKSLVKYLVENRDALLLRMTGNKGDTLTTLEDKLKGMEGNEQPLLTMIRSRDAAIAGLRTEAEQATAARDAARTDLQNELSRIKQIEDGHRATLAQLNNDISRYKDEIEQYRKGADDYKKATQAQLDTAKGEWNENEKRLNDQVSRLTEQKLILEAQIAKLRNDRASQLFRGQDEAALVDGGIISVNEGDRTAAINLGRKQKVVLGMTFAVYSTPQAIKPDDAGVYSPGKATLEVINVGETSSTCRITSEMRGNPVVRGDVLANAVYDPNKVYKFVVYGSFDADRDGVATPVEKDGLEAMIRAWGGDVVGDVQGDVDFVVLGERPSLPPRPAEDAALALQLEYKNRVAEVEKYDQLFRQGASTGVPVLNENRLYTLIGKTPSASRRAQRGTGQ